MEDTSRVEIHEPKPITPAFWIACVGLTLAAVGAMVWAMLNPDWLSTKVGKGEPLNMSFTVPGEFNARSLSDFRGRVIVVALWRTADCPDCLTQMASLHDLSIRYGREGLMAILLSEQDSLTLQTFPPLRGMAVMTGHIDNGQAFVLPKERPYTYVIDREGMVRRKFAGGQPAEKFESLIERLLGR